MQGVPYNPSKKGGVRKKGNKYHVPSLFLGLELLRANLLLRLGLFLVVILLLLGLAQSTDVLGLHPLFEITIVVRDIVAGSALGISRNIGDGTFEPIDLAIELFIRMIVAPDLGAYRQYGTIITLIVVVIRIF